MVRYKTTDGRIISLTEIYTKNATIQMKNVKTVGSEILAFPHVKNLFTSSNHPHTCLYGVDDESINFNFGIIGENGNVSLTGVSFGTGARFDIFKFNMAVDGKTYLVANAVANKNDDLNLMCYELSKGKIPILSFGVLANENAGSYTDIFLITAMPGNAKDRPNYFSMWDDFQSNLSFKRALLSFFNNTNNIVAEKDSTPVADENGFYDTGSDVISLPDIDTINVASALQTSGVKAHKLDITETNKVFSKLWSTDFFDTIIKNQQAPIDNILSLATYPYDVQGNGTSEEISVGTVPMGATGELITAQFQEINFGSIDCKEFYGNSLDYTYTDVDIFLPFIGTKSLDVNIIGGAVISLVYRVDILTGNCDAIITAKRSRDGTNLDAVLYIFSGNLQNQIPLTQRQNQSLLKLENAVQTTIQGAVMGNPQGGAAGGIAGLAAEGITMAMTGQPTTRYQMSGNLSTANGYMGVLTPYLTWYRPVNVKPSGYDKYYGYPSFFTRKLSDCKGYTQIHELISDAPTGVPADDWETIKQMLKDGVIIN